MIENISKIALILSGINLIVLVLLILFVKYTILEGMNSLYERIKKFQKDSWDRLSIILRNLSRFYTVNGNVKYTFKGLRQ